MIFSLTPLSVVSMPERFNPGLLSLSPVCPGKERWAYGLENNVSCYWKNSRSIPAATAEPMTPATLGPMACISKKLEGLYFWPSFCTTRAAIGTAETPAAPIMGFTLPLDSLHITLPSSTPPAVPTENAIRPRTMIFNVSTRRNASALAFAPTVIPRKTEIIIHQGIL